MVRLGGVSMGFQVFYGEGLYAALGVLVMAVIWIAGPCDGFKRSTLFALVPLFFLVAYMIMTWHDFADYPLTCPTPHMEIPGGDGPEYAWPVGSHSGYSKTCEASGVPGSKSETLAGGLEMQADCSDARAAWKIHVDGRLLEQGTLRPDRELDLTTVSIPPRMAARTVRFTTVRLDSAECEATFTLVDPGLEGAGHGRFRFTFPEFGDDL